MASNETPEEFGARFPAWLRIEPSCRQADFERGVQARLADPLWMLARQWQTGEFLGEDAASPIKAELRYSTQSIDRLRLGSGPSQPIPPGTPLEIMVEEERGEVDYRERARIGQEFERRLRARLMSDGLGAQVSDLISDLRRAVGFPGYDAIIAEETLDRATRRFIRFMRNRVIDGKAVLDRSVVVPSGSPIAQTTIDQVQSQVLAWYAQVCNQPASKQPPAWQPERLDYRFESTRSLDAPVEFGDIPLGTSVTQVERKGVRLSASGSSSIVVGGARPAAGHRWKHILECPTGVRIELPEPTAEFKVTFASLGGHRIHCFDEQNRRIGISTHRETATIPRIVQVGRKGGGANKVGMSTYRISGRGIARIEIHGHIAVDRMPVPVREESQLIASDYRNGTIDWYTFSANPESVQGGWQPPADPGLDPIITTPTRIAVSGTSPRWWAFEDGNTDFGDMNVTKLDLVKMLLMDFVLIHGDDWFSVPAPVSIGSMVKIDELKVWNVFNEWVIVETARKIAGGPRERFDLFSITPAGAPQDPGVGVDTGQDGDPPSPILLIPPVTGFRQESPALDQVHFLRDEGANMVWGVEHIVPNGLGRPVSGFDAQLECLERKRDELRRQLAAFERQLEFGDPSEEERAALEAAIQELQGQIADLTPYARPVPTQTEVPRYRLASSVPENWIPFIPVQRGSFLGAPKGAIQFRRAKMLRNTDHKWLADEAEARRHTDRKRMLEEAETLTEFMANEAAMSAMSRVLDLEGQALRSFIEASMPRAGMRTDPLSELLKDDDSISSMSRLLALDEEALLFLDEESVPRAGVRVQLTKQRVRWIDGSTHVWLGRKVLIGRGEGASGLRFDTVG